MLWPIIACHKLHDHIRLVSMQCTAYLSAFLQWQTSTAYCVHVLMRKVTTYLSLRAIIPLQYSTPMAILHSSVLFHTPVQWMYNAIPPIATSLGFLSQQLQFLDFKSQVCRRMHAPISKLKSWERTLVRSSPPTITRDHQLPTVEPNSVRRVGGMKYATHLLAIGDTCVYSQDSWQEFIIR